MKQQLRVKTEWDTSIRHLLRILDIIRHPFPSPSQRDINNRISFNVHHYTACFLTVSSVFNIESLQRILKIRFKF